MSIDSNVFEQLRELLAEMAASSREDIFPETDLEEELNMSLENDATRLVKRINRRFDIDLDQDLVVAELSEAGPTVLELTKLIHDELELG